MAALYAFCRVVDDVADDAASPVARRREELAAWREDVARACGAGEPHLAITRQLQPVIARYRLPFALFDELIRGCEMDLEKSRYQSHEELALYCHRVASVVGLLSIEIFGYRHPACRDYARHLGQALQLTNILRDVWTDAARGRIYLPLDELGRFGVAPEEILQGQYSERFRALAASVAARAADFYRRARRALPEQDRRAMIAAELMAVVYWRLLGELQRRQFNVFGPEPVRLNSGLKLLLVLRTGCSAVCGWPRTGYGPPD